jgi:hypothetical protein
MATKRLTHELTYPKGRALVTDELLQHDAEAQGERLGGATLVEIEKVGEKSQGGFYTYRATYEVPVADQED